MRSSAKHVQYRTIFFMGINDSMQYRLNFTLGLISAVFPIVIQMFIWKAVYSRNYNSVIYGFTYNQMILYTLLSALVSKFVASDGFEYEINEDIKNGGLNKYLIKPVSYSKYRISGSLGRKTPQSTILLIVLLIVLAVSSVALGQSIDIVRFVLFLISMCFATLLNIVMIYCISTAAFWLSDSGSFFLISSLVVNVLSGGIFPLEIFGKTLNAVFDFLPYKYTIYYPVTIINGKLEAKYILLIIGMQTLWIFLLLNFSKLLWRIGMKKYNAVGG